MKETIGASDSFEKVVRVLVVGRDQLIRSGRQYEVDFIPTGRSLTPHAPLGYAPTLLSKLEYLWALISGRYRLVVLPVPRDRSIAARLFAQPWIARLLGWLHPERSIIVLLDTRESSVISEAAIAGLHPTHYWKLNLPSDLPERNDTALHLLPAWAYPPASGWNPLPWRAKEIDLFLPPGPDCEARRMTLQWLERFRKEHRLKVRIATNELSESDLDELMSHSRVVISPVGEGFHHYRHYQAMLHGAVPLINHPPALETTLVHAENCLFYDAREDSFREMLLWTLEHPSMLEQLGRQARSYARRHHTPAAVGSALLQAAGFPSDE